MQNTEQVLNYILKNFQWQETGTRKQIMVQTEEMTTLYFFRRIFPG
jgi:hypothetical protein